MSDVDATVLERLQALPGVDEMLRRPQVAQWVEVHGRPLVLLAVRQAVAQARNTILAHGACDVDDAAVAAALETLTRPHLRPVLNATGVVLHTNLGRAPLAKEALQAAMDVGQGYSNLELDLHTGDRGSRYLHASKLLQEMLGVEDALVVNNCAAAVLLALSALAAGREAIISRGELVEIGGAFRIPDVVQQGGAILKEVGSTNRTRLADYSAAISAKTAVLLKVHRANFSMEGFVESTPVDALVDLGAQFGIPVLVDAGTGLLTPLEMAPQEPAVHDAVKQGAGLVMFSGDKLLGGPQAGILVGKRDLLDACRRHPLCRALRVDKFTLAALEATLRLHRDGRLQDIPAWRMLHIPVQELEHRAQVLQASLPQTSNVKTRVEHVSAKPGGGTLPSTTVPSVALILSPAAKQADALAAALRHASPAVMARIQDDQVVLDLRCVSPQEDATLQDVLGRVLGAWKGPAC